ncbi:MAG: DNA repair protein RecO [Deltaproteobacteria bacterium RIFOXYA12_FULL_58_15]|nr:MAG: DNA repair protein RecO [Deltaproteobacteria bacterium RIFOXYA12_FULL_58_15]OGR09401.1 MAG: DNA repair protein RecO [Deltaproteobacteria bacterium RIFOXYB12_FULL_58_9]
MMAIRSGARAQFETEGIVLYVRDFGDSNRILEVLTPEAGLTRLVARGGRASRRRFGGALDLFVSLRMQCSSGGGDLLTLVAADVLDARYGIRSSLGSIGRASVLVECGRLLAVEEQPMRGLYEAVRDGLDSLVRGDTVAAAQSYPRILGASGVAPNVGKCSRCGALSPLSVALDVSLPGVLCAECVPRRPTVPASAFLGAQLAAADAGALEEMVVTWVEAHVGRKFRSRVLMNSQECTGCS